MLKRSFQLWQVAFLLLTGITAIGQVENTPRRSKWDDSLPGVELRNVHVHANSLMNTWTQIVNNYLLRSCLYWDVNSQSDSNSFACDEQRLTGRELFDRLISVYSDYTYTQDKDTGVIWFHRKTLTYESILNENVEIQHQLLQVPMYSSVLQPLRRLLSSVPVWEYALSPNALSSYNYCVDLPQGIYTVRSVLNMCCTAMPDSAFYTYPASAGGRARIFPICLMYDNPFAPPRPGILQFWEVEVGKAAAGIPELAEIGAALADSDPRKRWAAAAFLHATPENYIPMDLVLKSTNSTGAVWAALALKEIETSQGEQKYITLLESMKRVRQAFTNNLTQLDPGLALLTSMELARENNDSRLMEVVADHKFTGAEIAMIKPELYRIARESKLVREELLKMHFDVPELSVTALSELESTNFFTLVPEDRK